LSPIARSIRRYPMFRPIDGTHRVIDTLMRMPLARFWTMDAVAGL